jgi:hypothetical protein
VTADRAAGGTPEGSEEMSTKISLAEQIAWMDERVRGFSFASEWFPMSESDEKQWNLESGVLATLLEHEALKAERDAALKELRHIRAKIRDKWLKYSTDMEGANEPEFGKAEWAADAFLQLMREEGIPMKGPTKAD